jgi:hypothetical protein
VGKDVPFQEQWWFRGGHNEPVARLVRAATDLAKRKFRVGKFSVMGFVCGEVWDGGSSFNPSKDTAGIDLILDLAHASLNRVWARNVRPYPRCAFQRMLFDLRTKCGAMVAFAHDVDLKERSLVRDPKERSLVRRQDNWIVFRGENPFPDSAEYEVLRLERQ